MANVIARQNILKQNEKNINKLETKITCRMAQIYSFNIHDKNKNNFHFFYFHIFPNKNSKPGGDLGKKEENCAKTAVLPADIIHVI